MAMTFNAAAVFQDIATHIQIGTDFTLHHTNHPEWPVSDMVVSRLQASSREIQAKFLCTQLSAYLHCLYFSRSLLPVTLPAKLETSSSIIDNNTVRGIDTAFFAQIEQANCSQGYYDPHWIVQNKLADDVVAVVKDGLCLQVRPQDRHPDQAVPQIGQSLSILMPKNLLTVDRYIAVGNQGRVQQPNRVYLYFNCPPQMAITLIAQISSNFNRLELPFEIHILLHPDEYPRADALILQCPDDAAAHPSLAKLIETHQSQFSAPIPAFTQPLARGVGKAIVTTGEDFPQPIWRAVAQALSLSWLQENTDIIAKINGIKQELQRVNIHFE